VLPGGRLLPRHIPSFCNVSFGELATDWPLDQNLHTAEIAMQRRGEDFSPAAQQLFRQLYEATAEERMAAVHLAQQKKIHRPLP
jgi:hypothetical protein